MKSRRMSAYKLALCLGIMTAILSLPVWADPVVGIVGGSFPETPSSGDPLDLSPFLRSQGILTMMMDGFEIANPDILNPERVDILIFPNGPYFPIQARQTFIDYLKAGGSFISLGGYAFDHLCQRKDDNWVEDKTVDNEKLLSGRRGVPGDTMRLRPDQIAIFDPTELFQRVARVTTAPGQHMLQTQVDLSAEIQGFAATAMSGSNNPVFPMNYARWISLLDSQDRYGRDRGSVLAAMFHHDGPFKGSAWAFSGVTDQDLFTKQASPLRNVLVEVIKILRQRAFLVWTDSGQVAYAPGTTASISVRVANFGSDRLSGHLRIMQSGREIGRKVVSVLADQVRDVVFDIKTDDLAKSGGIYRVELEHRGETIDSISGGIAILSEIDETRGPRISLQGNRFVVDRHSSFPFGTNQTGAIWFSPLENPEVWRRDFRWMRDHGLRILRVLHFSPFAANGYKGIGSHTSLDLKLPPPERLQKQTDALVRVCREEGIILFLTLHDWLEEELTDAELKAQREWNRFWTKRYRDERGVLFDIQNEPSIQISDTPEIRRLWNDYLKETYGTDETLRAAWVHSPPEADLGAIPLNEAPDDWSNVRRFDQNLFRARLLERWIAENVAGVKKGNPRALVTVGFLPDYFSAEKLLSTEHVDFANTHYYGSLDRFPLHLKLLDRRFEGKSFSLGEFGAQKAHDGRVNGQEGSFVESSVDRYLAIAHESFGLGAGFVLNWCLKDMPDVVFPWGLTYQQDGVDKDWAKVYRNLAFFFSVFTPIDRTPQTFLLVPDAHRMGGQSRQITEGIFTAIRWLFAEHIDFGVINEWDIDKLPDSAKVLIWPIPYCPQDSTCAAVHAFANAGGRVYFSGDIAFDRNRKRTRPDRFQALGLEPPTEHPPLEYPETAAMPAEASIAIGSGTIHFLPWPAELYPDRIKTPSPYRHLIEAASIEGIPVIPDDPQLHSYRILDRKGKTFLFFRMSEDKTPIDYKVQLDKTAASFSLAGYRGALFFLSRRGQLVAYEGSGELQLDGKPVLKSTGSVMIRCLDMRFTSRSLNLVIFPVDKCTLDLNNTALKQPVVVVGEFLNRDWQTYETFEPAVSDGAISIPIDADRTTCILILCEKGKEAASVKNLKSLLRL
ncbi:MAG: hypothetical protein ABIH23_19265 [bacterium]